MVDRCSYNRKTQCRVCETKAQMVATPRADRCRTVPFRVPAVPPSVPFVPYNQPFIPLKAIPRVKYRCPNRKIISTGSVTTTVPAISRSHAVVYCVWNTWSPT